MSSSYKTIDPTAVHENLHVRVSFLIDFLSFGESDADALHMAGPIIRPSIPTIVDSVYNKLLSFNITRMSFVEDRNKHLPMQEALETVTAGSDRMKYFKGFFGHWLLKIFISDYEDLGTFAYFDRVGIAHVGEASFRHREGRNKYKVDYMHIGLLLGFVSEAVISAIISKTSVLVEDKTRIICAFTKVMAIQNDLMSRHYVSPMAYSPCPAEHPSSTPRKQSTSSSTNRPTSNGPTCPFSGGLRDSNSPPSLGMEEFIEAPWSDDSDEEDLPKPSDISASNTALHHRQKSSSSDFSEKLSSIGPATPPIQSGDGAPAHGKMFITPGQDPILRQ